MRGIGVKKEEATRKSFDNWYARLKQRKEKKTYEVNKLWKEELRI